MFILEYKCKEDYHCNGHGECREGTCLCDSGWTKKRDCSGTSVIRFKNMVPSL